MRIEDLRSSALAAAMLLAAGAVPATAAAQSAEPSAEAIGLLGGVCLPAAKAKTMADAAALPKGFEAIDAEGAARFLGGEEGKAYWISGRNDTPVVAIWADGQCAVYVRQVADATGNADRLAEWLGGNGFALTGEPQVGTTPAGATMVVRSFATSDAPPLQATVAHHTREGKPGGITVTFTP